MEGAAQSTSFQSAECEIGTAMGAMAIDQAVAAFIVAEQHQVFAEQLDRPHSARALQLIDQRRRLPIHPHQLSASVLRADAGDQVVLFLAHHGASPHLEGLAMGSSTGYCSSIEHLFNMVTHRIETASDTLSVPGRKRPCPS